MLLTWATLPSAVRAVLARAHDEMCRALDCEMHAQEEPPLHLPDGRRVDAAFADRRTVYRFGVPSPRRLSESDRVECRFADRAVPGGTVSCIGTVMAADCRRLEIAFSDDFGPTLPAGGILVPRGCVGYMEARERLQRIVAGATPFNVLVALRMVGEQRLAASIAAGPIAATRLPDDLVSLRHLRLSQRDAIRGFLDLPFATLWGPPGTGKTNVLGLGVSLRALHGCIASADGTIRRPRTLVLGPTNLAIDEAMSRIAMHLSGVRSIREARVIRYGRHVTAPLVADFGDQIVLDRVVQRVRRERMRRAVDIAARLETRLDELQETDDLIANLPLELEDEHDRLIRRRQRLARYVEQLEVRARVHGKRFEGAFRRERALERELLSQCDVLGTTVHQALMSRRVREARWDCVVIDEASQVPFAMAYAAATVARETAWMVGDPRQLGPVVAAPQPAARTWMARDVFAVSGSVRDEPNARVTTAPWVSRLDWQHRMHPEICALVSAAYGGTLRTAPDVERARCSSAVRLPFAYAREARGVYLVDTTSLRPTARPGTGGSRANRTHVAVVRALVEVLDANGLVGPAGARNGGVAVISPFVAQAQWTARVLRERFPSQAVRCGTVHAYQGQETDTVILDLTESPGLELTEWMYARSWSEDGARLVTVGCSRPRQRLFVIAHCGYMYEQLQMLAPRPIVYRLLRYLEHWAGAVDVERDIVAFAQKRGLEGGGCWSNDRVLSAGA